jgi:hypothetical protein
LSELADIMGKYRALQRNRHRKTPSWLSGSQPKGRIQAARKRKEIITNDHLPIQNWKNQVSIGILPHQLGRPFERLPTTAKITALHQTQRNI